MPTPNSAAVLNQSEADFDGSAERVQWQGPDSVSGLIATMQEQALGLNNYIARYKEDIVIPFNRDPQTKQMTEGGNLNKLAFLTGAAMSFTMVDGVSRDTGAELPDLSSDAIEPADPDTLSFELDASTKVIDIFFRGPELRDIFPHIYRPSFKLMRELLMDPVEQLEADLETPLSNHRDPFYIAFPELHFIGGVAEVVLAIEQRAVAEKAQLN